MVRSHNVIGYPCLVGRGCHVVNNIFSVCACLFLCFLFSTKPPPPRPTPTISTLGTVLPRLSSRKAALPVLLSSMADVHEQAMHFIPCICKDMIPNPTLTNGCLLAWVLRRRGEDVIPKVFPVRCKARVDHLALLFTLQ